MLISAVSRLVVPGEDPAASAIEIVCSSFWFVLIAAAIVEFFDISGVAATCVMAQLLALVRDPFAVEYQGHTVTETWRFAARLKAGMDK